MDNPDKALEVLQKAGYQCRIDYVLAVDMGSDQPGTLDKILTHLKDANVFVRYLYISFDRKTSSYCGAETDEPETEPSSREGMIPCWTGSEGKGQGPLFVLRRRRPSAGGRCF